MNAVFKMASLFSLEGCGHPGTLVWKCFGFIFVLSCLFLRIAPVFIDPCLSLTLKKSALHLAGCSWMSWAQHSTQTSLKNLHICFNLQIFHVFFLFVLCSCIHSFNLTANHRQFEPGSFLGNSLHYTDSVDARRCFHHSFKESCKKLYTTSRNENIYNIYSGLMEALLL